MRLLLDVSAVPSRPVGAGRYVLCLVRELDARPDDVDLHLLTRRDDGPRWAALAPGASVHAEVPGHRVARLAWEQAATSRLVRRVAPDVWHGPHYTLPLRLDVPAVVTMHDTTFLEHPEWHERSKVRFFRPMIAAAVRRAGAVVAVSATTARTLERLLAPTAPVVVAPHGVDQRQFAPRAVGDPDDLALLRGLGVRPPFVVFVGTLEPRKDVPSIVHAFAGVAADRPDLRLVLAGPDGWATADVRDAVRGEGVATRVVRLGWVPDDAVPALYRQAEIVAYPSLEEGFGLPALEALACGAALVTTSGTSMAEFAGGAARLVTPGDTAALGAALRDLLDDPAAAATLRAAGPGAAAGHTWAHSAQCHLDAYALALASPAPPAPVTAGRS